MAIPPPPGSPPPPPPQAPPPPPRPADAAATAPPGHAAARPTAALPAAAVPHGSGWDADIGGRSQRFDDPWERRRGPGADRMVLRVPRDRGAPTGNRGRP